MKFLPHFFLSFPLAMVSAVSISFLFLLFPFAFAFRASGSRLPKPDGGLNMDQLVEYIIEREVGDDQAFEKGSE